MTFAQRIARILELTKESRASLVKRTGISKTALSDFLAGRTDPSFTTTVALIKAFPNYNARGLLTGVKSKAVIDREKAKNRHQDMMKAAEEYFTIVRQQSPNQTLLAAAESRLNELSAQFSDDPAFQALLKLERETNSRIAEPPKVDPKVADFLAQEKKTLEQYKQAVVKAVSLNKSALQVLMRRMREGQINGTTGVGSIDGFNCLFGTLAKAQGIDWYKDVPGYIDDRWTAEGWFYQIKLGDTPSTNAFSRLAYEWISEYQRSLQ